jgi:hypothetical protein
MKTYFLCGDMDWIVYGGKWITKKLNNGDWNYWLVIEFINLHEATGDKTDNKYQVSISAISPKAAGWKKIRDVLRCCGIRFKDFNSEYLKNGGKLRLILEVLSDYGLSAPLDSFSGNNAHKLLQKARQALTPISGMFGFFMDGSKNRLGHNGWNFISGDLSLDNLPKSYVPNMHVV